jgi:hypothetical protein
MNNITTKQKQHTQRIHLALLELSASYGKMLTAMHHLHNTVRADAEDTMLVEQTMDALNAIPDLRQTLKTKYPTEKVIFKQ